MRKTAIFAAVVAGLLAFVANAETCTPTNIVAAPLTDAHWTQNAPYNEYSPLNDKGANWAAGCVAIAAAQELLVWQWPWRFGAIHEASHIVAGSDNATIRFDGTVPFEWDALKDSYLSSDSLASRHAAARLALFCQSLVQMQFVSSGGEAKKGIDGTMEWYEYDGNVTPSSGEAAVAKILSDLEFGSPLQVGVNVGGYGGHEVVGVGYGIGTNAIGETVRLLGLNMGWGGSVQWWNLASTSGSYVKSAKVGFRPIKSVQIEPVAPVSGNSVTLNWHLPNCYTNKIDGFAVAKKTLSASTTTWTDDFSTGGKGRSSNANAMRVKDGALFAWDGTASSIYTFDEKFALTSDSILTYDVGSAYMSGMQARFEAKFGEGEWQKIGDIHLNGGRTSYYDKDGAPSTMTSGVAINLGVHGGKIAQFRIAIEYTSGGTYANNWASMKIDNLAISNVRTFDAGSVTTISDASARGTTQSGLETGVTYAFSVAPIMSDGSASVTQTVTTVVGTPAAAPGAIGVTAVINGIEMLQDDFYLECGSGTTTFTVTSANATELKALPSHLSILPDNAVSVSGNAGVFTVTIDGSKLSSRWEGAKTILTLKASNGDGAVAAKDIVLKFNRNVVMSARTYALTSDANATAAVEFIGGTTIDGNGHMLTVKAGAFTGTGDVTLTNGTFIFEDLGDFGGTINVDTSAAVSFTGTSCPVLKGTGTITISANATLNDYSAWDGTVVVLSGTTVTVPSSGLGWTEVEGGGTLKVVLTDEEIAYGYATTKIANSGTVILIKRNGAALVSATTWSGNAKQWTGTNPYWGENYTDSSAWGGGNIATNGDYAIFNVRDEHSEGWVVMIQDNDSEISLPWAKVTGNGKLEIATGGKVVPANIIVEKVENDAPLKITSSYFRPKVVNPDADIEFPESLSFDFVIDSSKADYLKAYQTAPNPYKAVANSDVWQGTVVFTGRQDGAVLNNYGNISSFVRFNGANGYLGSDADQSYNPTLELVDNGDAPAFNWNNGWTNRRHTFRKIVGDGMLLATSKNGSTERIVVNDMSQFFGGLNLLSKTIVIGTTVNTNATTGLLEINNGYSAAIASGKTWTIGGGVFLDGTNAHLTVNGILDTPMIFARSANAPLTLADGGIIMVDTIPSDSNRFDFRLYAGTFRIDGDATVSDGFCFSSTNDTYTTIDVNGHELTFGSNAISGHGVVYPTSSAENTKGRVAFQDMGSFTGDIIIDGTTVVEFPDDMSSFEGRIRLTGSEMATSAGYEGNVALSDGAVLTLSLSDGQVVSGYSTDKVTLDDSSTLAFADRNGNVLAVFTSADDTYTYVAPGQAETESLEETGAAVTTESQLAFKDATLAMLTSEALGGKFGGAWAGTADGADVVFNNFNRTAEAAGTITCQAQVANDGYVKGVLLTFTQSGGDVYVFMTGAKYIQGASLGDSIVGGNNASQDGEWMYAVSALSLKYLGPVPMAVWVAGEFDDDRSAHGGLEISLNGNTTNALGQIVIGDDVATGATIKLPDDTFTKASILVKYELASEGAPVANAAPVGVISTDGYPIVPICTTEGETTLKGAYLNKDNAYALVTNSGNYWPFSVEPTISNGEGYILLSYHSELANPMSHGTAVYVGSSVNTLTGGNASGLQWKTKTIDKIAIGGPTTAGGANPWKGMIIKEVALFADEWLAPSDLATYRFPKQGAVLPEDSDRYAIEPVARWVNDFKTTEKNGCTLSVSGTTAAKDDSFGGTLTIGDASAVVDVRNTANGGNVTVLVKYRAASNAINAPVVTFGETLSNSVKIDVGAYTQSARTLAVNRSYNGGNNKWVALNTAASLNEGEGYLLCARKNNDMLVYVGNSLDNMTGGSTAAPGDITYSCDLIQAIGIGGPSGLPNADATWSAFDGFVVEKVVVFNGYYTPDEIRYVPDTLSIANGATLNFAAGTTREYVNIGTLNAGGTIAITNASELVEGSYMLATWTMAQKKSTGYGHVGTLDVTGLPAGLSAELVYGARAIYLRVWNPTTQAEKGTIKVWPYGDSITEGFNAGGTRANYRVLLAQKLSMLGFNVEMVGCYDKINGANGIDPSGQVIPDAWKWHSAKHGATAGPTTSAAARANLCENVDTLCAQAGNPDVVLLLAGANDIVPQTGLSAQQVVSSITNIVAHLATNLPDSKIVVGTQINVEYGYNGNNYSHVTNMIPQVNALLKAYAGALPEALNGKVFLADLNAYVKSGEYGILFDHGSDHLHPDWWGHDQMAEGWLSIITNQFTSTQVFPSATIPTAPAADELGAAAKSELAEYCKGYQLCRRIDAASNLDAANPYAYSGDGATNNIEKVAYFVEYVRADNNAHKWVWVDIDAFGATIGDVGLPSANHQQVVTKLHVKSNHNGIDDVAADDDSVTGFIEFSPYDYNGNVSGVTGAPAGNGSCCDWNDTLSESGSYSCMQVHRVFSPAKAASDGITRGGQVLFAYNNWQSSSSTAEFGIGNFSSHFYRGASDAQTLDYTYTANAPKMNASAYSVKRIEIWTKEKATDTDFPTPYSWIDMYFPELVSGWSSTQYNDFATNKNHGSVKNGYAPWESYVLGLDPTDEASKFLATIRMDGTTPIVEFSPTNETIAIQYILQGKPTLTNGWQNVEFHEPGATNRFFRVRVTW